MTQTVPDISPLMPMHQDPLLGYIDTEPSKLFTKRHCVLVLEISYSSTKSTFVSMLSAWCVLHVVGCALSMYHLRLHLWILGSCGFILSLRCYWAHGEFKMVSNQHIANTKFSWTHTSTNLLGTHKRPSLSPYPAFRGKVWGVTLQWRQNERDGVSNHLLLDCLLNRLLRRIKGNIKSPRHWPSWGESTGHRWIPLTNGR